MEKNMLMEFALVYTWWRLSLSYLPLTTAVHKRL